MSAELVLRLAGLRLGGLVWMMLRDLPLVVLLAFACRLAVATRLVGMRLLGWLRLRFHYLSFGLVPYDSRTISLAPLGVTAKAAVSTTCRARNRRRR